MNPTEKRSNVYLDANGGIPVLPSVRSMTMFDYTNPSNVLAKAGQITAKAYAKAEATILSKLTKSPDVWKFLAISGATEGIATVITNAARIPFRTSTATAATRKSLSSALLGMASEAAGEATSEGTGEGKDEEFDELFDEDFDERESVTTKEEKDKSDLSSHFSGRILCLNGYHPCITEISERWKQMYGVPLNIDFCEPSMMDVATKVIEHDYRAIFITLVISLTGQIVNSAVLANVFKTKCPNGVVIVDGTQAVGKMPVTLETTGADVLIFSGHKFGSLKGVGGLIVRQTLLPTWLPLIPGSQQDGLRGGTHNVQGVISMAKALEEAVTGLPKRIDTTRSCLMRICDLIVDAKLPRVTILSPSKGTDSTGNTILLSVPFCSRRIAGEMRKLGYDIGIGTACQTAHGPKKDEDPAKRQPFLIRVSMYPGQVIDEKAFVDALRTAYQRALQALSKALKS